MSNLEQIFSEVFGIKPIKEYVELALQNNGFMAVEELTKQTKRWLFAGKYEKALLFPSEREMRVIEEICISDTATIYLVAELVLLPTESMQRRRWWICVYKGCWESTKCSLKEPLKDEGPLNWRKSELPWIVRDGIIMSFDSDSEAKIACARKREQA